MIRTGLIGLLVLALAGTAAAGLLPDLSTHKDVRAEVEIDASAEQVWRVLTDFPAYDIWNPYIYPASGQAAAGRTLDLTLRGGTVIHFAPTVLVAKPGEELTWAGKMPLGAVERVLTFALTPLGPHRVRLVATERFRGIALPLVSGVTDDAAAGLAAMTRALRDRVELLDFTLPAPR